jgi:transposase
VPPLRSKRGLEPLKALPETEIKAAFAEIIGEPINPKDWGGERSDLFSSRVMLERKRISSAFVFKGPAQFRPMTMAQLGKNGDQIDRLFSEPADLVHEIDALARQDATCGRLMTVPGIGQTKNARREFFSS